MKKFDRTRECFLAQVEIDFVNRLTLEPRTVLKYHNIASPVKEQTPLTPEEYQTLVEEGKHYHASFKLSYLVVKGHVQVNVAFSSVVFEEGGLRCDKPITNPFIEEQVFVPVVIEDGVVYCDLTGLTKDLEEYYV